MPALIVVGDKTTHGGTVVQGAPTTDTGSKAIARVGDMTVCPKKGHGSCPIVTGDPTLLIDGKPAARHGDRTACGAILISSQIATNDDPGGGEAVPAAFVPDGQGDWKGIDPPPQEHDQAYDEYFVLVDEESSTPIRNRSYRITLATGEILEGQTDNEGRTQYVAADKRLMVQMEVGPQRDIQVGD